MLMHLGAVVGAQADPFCDVGGAAEPLAAITLTA